MAEVRNIICISCPLGCQLVVTKDGDNISVTGNTCKNGEKYGIEEMTNPKRVIPSTVVCKNGRLKRLPVKTADAVPKGMIFGSAMEEEGREWPRGASCIASLTRPQLHSR